MRFPSGAGVRGCPLRADPPVRPRPCPGAPGVSGRGGAAPGPAPRGRSPRRPRAGALGAEAGSRASARRGPAGAGGAGERGGRSGPGTVVGWGMAELSLGPWGAAWLRRAMRGAPPDAPRGARRAGIAAQRRGRSPVAGFGPTAGNIWTGQELGARAGRGLCGSLSGQGAAEALFSWRW